MSPHEYAAMIIASIQLIKELISLRRESTKQQVTPPATPSTESAKRSSAQARRSGNRGSKSKK